MPHGSGQTYGPFFFNYGYTQSFDGAAVVRHVELNFTFEPNITTAQQKAFRSTAETGVEGIRNNRAIITDTTTQRSFPLRVDVTTSGPVFDHNIFVNSGPGRSDTSTWYAGSVTAGVMAHEVGHYLGLYDEYIGGGVDRYPNPTLSTALMGTGANDENPQMVSRYYQGYLDFITGLNPGSQFTLVMAPEPPALLMLLSGMIGILFFRRNNPSTLKNGPRRTNWAAIVRIAILAPTGIYGNAPSASRLPSLTKASGKRATCLRCGELAYVHFFSLLIPATR